MLERKKKYILSGIQQHQVNATFECLTNLSAVEEMIVTDSA